MAGQVEPRGSSRSPAAAGGGGGALSQTGPLRLPYEPVDAVGFEMLPGEIRAAVTWQLLGDHVAAAADRVRVRRRADGTTYQFARGWWASTERIVIVEGRRSLASLGDGRFRPSGQWEASSKTRQLVSGARAVRSCWRQGDGQTGQGERPRARTVDDPLAILPGRLVAPLQSAGEVWGHAWQLSRKGWVQEVVVALALRPDRALVLRAEREATRKSALESAEWAATTLDAAFDDDVRPLRSGSGGVIQR